MSYNASTTFEPSAIVLALGEHQIVSGPIDDPVPTVAFINRLVADAILLAGSIVIVHCGRHGEGLARTQQEGAARMRELVRAIHSDALADGDLAFAESVLPGGQLDAIDWPTVAGLVALVEHETFPLEDACRLVAELKTRAVDEAARNGAV